MPDVGTTLSQILNPPLGCCRMGSGSKKKTARPALKLSGPTVYIMYCIPIVPAIRVSLCSERMCYVLVHVYCHT